MTRASGTKNFLITATDKRRNKNHCLRLSWQRSRVFFLSLPGQGGINFGVLYEGCGRGWALGTSHPENLLTHHGVFAGRPFTNHKFRKKNKVYLRVIANKHNPVSGVNSARAKPAFVQTLKRENRRSKRRERTREVWWRWLMCVGGENPLFKRNWQVASHHRLDTKNTLYSKQWTRSDKDKGSMQIDLGDQENSKESGWR